MKISVDRDILIYLYKQASHMEALEKTKKLRKYEEKHKIAINHYKDNLLKDIAPKKIGKNVSFKDLAEMEVDFLYGRKHH